MRAELWLYVTPGMSCGDARAILADAGVVQTAKRQREQNGICTGTSTAMRAADHDLPGVARVHPGDGIEQQHAPAADLRYLDLIHSAIAGHALA